MPGIIEPDMTIEDNKLHPRPWELRQYRPLDADELRLDEEKFNIAVEKSWFRFRMGLLVSTGLACLYQFWPEYESNFAFFRLANNDPIFAEEYLKM